MIRFAALVFAALGCLGAGFAVALSGAGRAAPSPAEEVDWRGNWEVKEGFSISKDAEGFHLPTSIAFVPNPGSAPKDPLYFVTELRGKVKVVTNDRSVYTFAEGFFESAPEEELPSGQGQTGMAGVCLAPEQGYVFVTYAYQDERGLLRNDIMRFQATPDTFSLEPEGEYAFTDVFRSYETGLAHQIGACQVRGSRLYVGVGEGWKPFLTQDLDYMHGKLLRMTLDGQPVPENPFYEDDDVTKARNFVVAYGLRNPFGLELIGGNIFVADNGGGIDRFVRIEEGENYLWDGTDASIASNADFVWVPSVGPVQMDYSGEASFLPEEYQRAFFVALSGAANNNKMPGIDMVQYELEGEHLAGVPQRIVRYRGNEYQMVTGLAFGPDGLYFAPLMDAGGEESAILKVTYDPSTGYPYAIGHNTRPMELMKAKGCVGCHVIGNTMNYGAAAAPPLPRGEELVSRLQTRLASEHYEEQVAAIDTVEQEPQASYRTARQEVLEAEGVEKVRTWLTYYIQNPTFDRQHSAMPDLGLTEAEARTIANYLVAKPQGGQSFTQQARARLVAVIPQLVNPKYMAAFLLLVGIGVGGGVVGLAWLIVGRRRRMPKRDLVSPDEAAVPA